MSEVTAVRLPLAELPATAIRSGSPPNWAAFSATHSTAA
jgi:hypothetical protein